MSDDLRGLLETHVGDGSLPGAVALVAHGEDVEVAAVGSVDTAGTAPMARDSLFRVASVTKPVTAAATMALVEDGLLALDMPVARWLPELAAPMVVRTPSAPLDDVVPAARPITVADLLTFRAGYGFPADFSLPAVAPLFGALKQGPPRPQEVAAPDAWTAALGRIPLLHQPGEAWLYNTCSDILGVLIARATGLPFQDVLAERVFEPLGMRDTAFAVPPGKSAGSPATTGPPRTAAGWSSWTRRTASGAPSPPSRPARAAWSPPSTTCTPSAGCCSREAPTGAAGGCSRRTRCGR